MRTGRDLCELLERGPPVAGSAGHGVEVVSDAAELILAEDSGARVLRTGG